MEPKKRTLIFGVTGFILVVILAFGVVLNRNTLNTTRPKEPQAPEVVQSIIRQALDTRTPSRCYAIHDDARRAYCNDNVLIVAASDKNDPSICKQIVDKATSTACFDNFLITSALNSRDVRVCDTLTDKNRVSQCKTDVQAFIDSQKQ